MGDLVKSHCFTPTTLDDAMKLADWVARSNYYDGIRNPMQAMVKIMAGAEMGFGPAASLADVHFIDGKPVIGAHLMAAAIKRSGKYDYRIIQLNRTVCELEAIHDGKSLGTVKVTYEECKESGMIFGKDGKSLKRNWKVHPDDMLFARCVSKMYRRYFPDLSGGVLAYDPDELDVHQEPVERQPEPAQSLPEPQDAEFEVVKSDEPEPPLTLDRILDWIDQLCLEMNISYDKLKERTFELYEVDDPKNLALQQAEDLLRKLQKRQEIEQQKREADHA